MEKRNQAAKLLIGLAIVLFAVLLVGGVVSAEITEDDMRNILYRNAESILGKDW